MISLYDPILPSQDYCLQVNLLQILLRQFPALLCAFASLVMFAGFTWQVDEDTAVPGDKQLRFRECERSQALMASWMIQP